MKKSLTFFLAFFCCQAFCQYASQNMLLLGNYDDPTVPSEPYYGIRYNGMWGYAANNKEYAIMGSTTGTYIIDVTDPANPLKVGFFAGRRDSCIWREYKTYGNYLYAVSDDPISNSLQIFDLSTLPSATKVYDSDSIFRNSHTIFVDGDKLYTGSVTTTMGYAYSMAVYSLQDPTKPLFLRALNQDYPFISSVHDMFVRNDTVFASCGYSNSLYVFKFESNNTFRMLGSLTSYPEQGYSHSSAWSSDGKTLVFCDEVPAGLKVKVADVSDLTDIKIVSSFESSGPATPHNPYMIGNDKVVIAYYTDGVQLYDISDPANPVRTGFFDTYPDNLTQPYAGCWGAYVDLPSGNIIASDMQRGLFILDAAQALSVKAQKTPVNSYSVFPNPFNDKIRITLAGMSGAPVEVSVHDITGKEMLRKQAEFSGDDLLIEMPSDLEKGVYVLSLSDKKGKHTYRLVK